jgi:hypothetical protein
MSLFTPTSEASFPFTPKVARWSMLAGAHPSLIGDAQQDSSMTWKPVFLAFTAHQIEPAQFFDRIRNALS